MVKFYFILTVIMAVASPCHNASAEISPPDTAELILVDGAWLNAPEVLAKYVQQKSESCSEKTAGDWLKKVCLDNGLFISDFGSGDGNYNFAASLVPLEKKLPNVIFLNHIDVVSSGYDSLWKYPPYSGEIVNGEVWGRGAFDNKGPAIMQLFSLIHFKNKHPKVTIRYNLTFLAVSCEETFCDGGVQYVLENHHTSLNPAVVIGEGATELNSILELDSETLLFGISVAHKRPLWLELNLTIPTSGHGSVTPIEYANQEMTLALSRLIGLKKKIIFNEQNKRLIKALGGQQKGLKKFVMKHPSMFKSTLSRQLQKRPELFALFSNTVTITNISSNNSTINKIPKSTQALLDCRLMPAYPNDKFVGEIKKTLKNDDIEIKIIGKMDEMEPSKIENDMYAHLKAAILSAYPASRVWPIMLPNYSDVGAFRSMGTQAYSVIPVELGLDCLKSVHGYNERIPIKALYQGIEVYTGFINRCQSNQLD